MIRVNKITFDKTVTSSYTDTNMKKIRLCILAAVIVMTLCGLLLAGCASAPPPAEPESVEPAPEPEPAEEPAENAEKTPEEPIPEEKPEDDDADEFEVTEEVYEQTFKDVENLITELNSIISSRSYSEWLTYLTDQYKERYSDPAVLAELSNQPTLKEYDIRLRSLEDYFRYVVVPSRSEVRLDDIIFTDEKHVKAIMEVDDRQVILYRLRLVDGRWKIGLAK
mgnify:CR=1 FL=1